MLTINCDGGARGNPGPAASACVVSRDGKIIFSTSKYLGESTNNTAEYEGVLLGFKYLVEKKISEDVTFILDSLLVVNQMSGKFKIKNENLISLFKEAQELKSKLAGNILYTYVPREKNKEADKLVNITLDENQ